MSRRDTSRKTRPVLTRERIVDAATAIVDEAGPDALTMRAVAQRLDAGAMSLYRHVASREELLDLVLAAMASEVELRALTGDWRTDLAQAARDMRAALLRRPNLTVLLTSRAGSGSGGLELLDHALAILRAAGFTPDQAVFANHALGNFVAGAALWEAVGFAGASGADRDERRAAAGTIFASLPAGEYPALSWAGDAILAGSLDDRFEFGLGLLLDGLSSLLVDGDPEHARLPG